MTRNFDRLYQLCRCGLGGIFIYAGSVKLLEPTTFAILIEAYGMLPDALLLPVSIALSALEVAAGIGLLFDIRGSLAVITALLGLFIMVTGYGLWMGLDVDCGCFGPEDPEAAAFHGLRATLLRELTLLAVVAFLYGWRRYRAIHTVQMTRFIDQLLKKRRTENAAA